MIMQICPTLVSSGTSMHLYCNGPVAFCSFPNHIEVALLEEMTTPIRDWTNYGTPDDKYDFNEWDMGEEPDGKEVKMNFPVLGPNFKFLGPSSTAFRRIGDSGVEVGIRWDDSNVWFDFLSTKWLQEKETFSVLISLEVTRGESYLLDREKRIENRKDNLCFDKVIQFSRKSEFYMQKGTLKLQNLLDGNYFLRSKTDWCLFVLARVYIRSEECPPGIYLPRVKRAHLIPSYGAEAVRIVKAECTKMLQSFDKSELERIAHVWNTVDEQQRKKELSHPEGMDELLHSAKMVFPFEESIAHLLSMEILHFGLNAVKKANSLPSYKRYLLTEPVGKDGKVVVGEDGKEVVGIKLVCSLPDIIHGRINRKLEAYRAWAESVSETGEHVELEMCGLLAIQLLAVYVKLCELIFFCEDIELKEKREQFQKVKKGKSVENASTGIDFEEKEHGEDHDPNGKAQEDGSERKNPVMPANVGGKIDNEAVAAASVKNQPVDDDKLVPWIRPPSDDEGGEYAKVDCDGAFTPDICAPLRPDRPPPRKRVIIKHGKAGHSTIIRVRDPYSEHGIRIVLALAVGAKPVSSVYHELQGLKAGFQQAYGNGLRRVLVSADCQQAICAIEGGFARDRILCKYDRGIDNELRDLVNKIVKIRGDGFIVAIICHQYRGANEPANWLAALGKRISGELKYGQAQINTDPELRVLKKLTDADAQRRRYRPEGLTNYYGMMDEAD